MLINEQLHKLNQYKDYFSKLLLNVQSFDKLHKNEVNYLYNAITKSDLVNLGISIYESRKDILKGILDDLNDSTREWHYKVNSGEFQFIVDLIRDIDRDVNINIERSSMINTLQEAQAIIQNRKDEIKLKIGSKFFAYITDQKDYNEHKKLKSTLHRLEVEKHKIELEPKIEEWQVKLYQEFEESKHKQLDIVAKESNSKFISELIDKTNRGGNNEYSYINRTGFQYRTLAEILNKDNLTRKDKKILLKWFIHQVKTFLEDKDKTLTEWDKEALNEILKDLQKENNKSKEDFDPQNDGYIQRLREAMSVPQSTLQEALVQQGQRDISTPSMLMF